MREHSCPHGNRNHTENRTDPQIPAAGATSGHPVAQTHSKRRNGRYRRNEVEEESGLFGGVGIGFIRHVVDSRRDSKASLERMKLAQ